MMMMSRHWRSALTTSLYDCNVLTSCTVVSVYPFSADFFVSCTISVWTRDLLVMYRKDVQHGGVRRLRFESM